MGCCCCDCGVSHGVTVVVYVVVVYVVYVVGVVSVVVDDYVVVVDVVVS